MEIITCHKNADFDAFASVFAAKILYPDANPILPHTLNSNVKAFFALHKDFFPHKSVCDINLNDVSHLIVVDAHEWSRFDNMAALKKRDDVKISLWDHHEGETDLKPSWSNVRRIGATVTLLVQEIRERGIYIDPVHASLFLAGIHEDTGSLMFSGSTAEDAEMVAWLMKQKADNEVISHFLRSVYTQLQREILFDMFHNGTEDNIGGYRIIFVNVSIKGYTPGLSIVVEMYQDITSVDAVFAVFSDEHSNRYMVIARSNTEGIDAGAVMRALGGGGHARAASAQLIGDSSEKVLEWVIHIVAEASVVAPLVKDIMSSPVDTVLATDTMEEVFKQFRKGYSGIPVVDEKGTVVGMLSRRDLKRLRKDSHKQSPAKAFMTTGVFTIAKCATIAQAARIMVSNDIGRLPVLENEELIGIVTRSDVMRHYYNFSINEHHQE